MSVTVPVIDTFDGDARRIYLKQGVTSFHWIEDIYREYVHERAITEVFRKWAPLMQSAGNNPKGGGKFTPRYVTMLEGARVVPYDENILITVTGEAITDNADIDPDPFDTSTRTQPLKLYITPPAAEIVNDVEALASIAHMSFDGEIWHDVEVGFTIAEFTRDPGLLGNNQYPIKLQDEAHAIAQNHKIKNMRMTGLHTMISDLDWSGFLIHGDSAVTSILNIDATPDVSNCTIKDMTVSGTLDGGIIIRDSIIDGLSFFNGILHECAFTTAPFVLGGVASANLFSCYSAVPGGDARPQVDFNHGSTPLAMRNWFGGIELVNKSVAEGAVLVDVGSGIIYVRSSCTAGTIVIRGVGLVVDESGAGCTVDSSGLLKPDEVALTAEKIQNIMEHVSYTAEISEDGTSVIIYDRDNVTPLHEFLVTNAGKKRTLLS